MSGNESDPESEVKPKASQASVMTLNDVPDPRAGARTEERTDELREQVRHMNFNPAPPLDVGQQFNVNEYLAAGGVVVRNTNTSEIYMPVTSLASFARSNGSESIANACSISMSDFLHESTKYLIREGSFGCYESVIIKSARDPTKGEIPWDTASIEQQRQQAYSVLKLRMETLRLRKYWIFIPGIMPHFFHGAATENVNGTTIQREFIVLPKMTPITEFYALPGNLKISPTPFVHKLTSIFSSLHDRSIGILHGDIRLKNLYIQAINVDPAFKNELFLSGFEHSLKVGLNIISPGMFEFRYPPVDYLVSQKHFDASEYNMNIERGLLGHLIYDLYFHVARGHLSNPQDLRNQIAEKNFTGKPGSYELSSHAKDSEMYHFCLLASNKDSRFSTQMMTNHPMLWPPQTTIEFLCTFENVRSKTRVDSNHRNFVCQLELLRNFIYDKDTEFTEYLPIDLKYDIDEAARTLNQSRILNTSGLKGLLKLIRNKFTHISLLIIELMKEILPEPNLKEAYATALKTEIGKPYSAEKFTRLAPDEFLSFIMCRFPKLVLELYNHCLKHKFYDDPDLKKFFPHRVDGATLVTDEYIQSFEKFLRNANMPASKPQAWMTQQIYPQYNLNRFYDYYD